jgi:hypothetical protein
MTTAVNAIMIHPLRVCGQAFSHHEPALRTHLSTFGFIPAQSYFQTYFCGDTRISMPQRYDFPRKTGKNR